MFTDDQKDDIRRFCGYYVFGSQPIQTFAWRYTNQYGHLEFVMNNLTSNQENIVETIYLPNLYTLELQIPTVAQNLDTLQAAVWKWNNNEERDRWKLFNNWRRYLCGYLGVEVGPMLANTGVSFVV